MPTKRSDAPAPSKVLEPKTFWLTERAHQVIDWLRREEADAAKKRQAERAKRLRQERCGRERRGYVERVRAAQGDMEVLTWGALRLLILFSFCALACSVIGLVVIVFVAAQEVGPARAGIVVGGALSMVTTGGTLTWRIVSRRGRARTDDCEHRP